MVVIVALIAVAIPLYRNSLFTARYKKAVTIASTYQAAVAAFGLDHGTLPPKYGTADWPATSTSNLGPMNTLIPSSPRPYMRTGTPDDISGGLGVLVMGTSMTPVNTTARTYSYIGYVAPVTASPRSYAFFVYSRKSLSTSWTSTSDKQVRKCILSNDVVTGWSPCSA